jgi:hypothetical protein
VKAAQERAAAHMGGARHLFDIDITGRVGLQPVQQRRQAAGGPDRDGLLDILCLKALAAVCLSAMMFGLEISSVPVILPTLQTQLSSQFSDLQWIMNAYTLACTTVLMAVGTLVAWPQA